LFCEFFNGFRVFCALFKGFIKVFLWVFLRV
jgi:hypothetical protein